MLRDELDKDKINGDYDYGQFKFNLKILKPSVYWGFL